MAYADAIKVAYYFALRDAYTLRVSSTESAVECRHQQSRPFVSTFTIKPHIFKCSLMVKIGGRARPLSRRELERLEKERKRALEDGRPNPLLVGEPRQNLCLLLSLSKRPRIKHLPVQDLEEIKRKREKNKKRTEARKLAKAVLRGANASSEQ